MRNEIDPEAKTDFVAKPRTGITIAALALLHFVCCGVPLLLLSGVTLATIVPSWPVVGGSLALLGIVGFVWYVRKGCATCPGNQTQFGERTCRR